MRILLIEDEEKVSRFIVKGLTAERYAVDTASDGKRGLELVQTYNYDLIILDLMLPEMDGFEVARRLKERKNNSTLIMMLSSAGDSGDGARCRQLGISIHLLKPISPSDLLKAIGQLLARGAEMPTVDTSAVADAANPPKRILLAEDNPTNRTLALKILERRGHHVLVAENGKEAVDLLERTSVDLVLMDVQMPVMGGLEATRLIRERERVTGRHLPIVAMTAHAMKGDRERCIEGGMDDYISKPIDSGKLLKLVDRIGTPAPPASPEVDAPAAADDACDLAAFIERVGGDEELAREMALLFIPDATRLLGLIEQAVEDGDAERLRLEAHALKGAAGNFGAARTVDAAKDLEQMGRVGDLTRSREVADALREDTERLIHALRTFGEAPTCAS
jgi:CheY-like chemotaxis protein